MKEIFVMIISDIDYCTLFKDPPRLARESWDRFLIVYVLNYTTLVILAA